MSLFLWTWAEGLATVKGMPGTITRAGNWLLLGWLGLAACAGKEGAGVESGRQAALVYVMLTGRRQGAAADIVRRQLAERLQQFQLRVMKTFARLVQALAEGGDCQRQGRRALAVFNTSRQAASRLKLLLQGVALALGRREIPRAWQAAKLANQGAWRDYQGKLDPGLARLKSFADRCPEQAQVIARSVTELFRPLN